MVKYVDKMRKVFSIAKSTSKDAWIFTRQHPKAVIALIASGAMTTAAIAYKKAIGTFLTMNFLVPVLAPALTPLLPKAEDVFRKKGYEEGLVQKIAPKKNVYIRGRDAFSRFHLEISAENEKDYSTDALMGGYNDNYNGYTKSDNGPVTRYWAPNSCIITTGYDAQFKSARKMLHEWADIELIHIKDDFNVSSRDIERFLYVHELSHCRESFVMNGFVAKVGSYDFIREAFLSNEARSDAEGIKNPDGTINRNLAEFVINARALNIEDDITDTSLILDAIVSGKKPPSAGEIIVVRRELEKLKDYTPNGSENLSPLTRKRLDLKKAAEMFFIKPEMMEDYKRVEKQKRAQENPFSTGYLFKNGLTLPSSL